MDGTDHTPAKRSADRILIVEKMADAFVRYHSETDGAFLDDAQARRAILQFAIDTRLSEDQAGTRLVAASLRYLDARKAQKSVGSGG